MVVLREELEIDCKAFLAGWPSGCLAEAVWTSVIRHLGAHSRTSSPGLGLDRVAGEKRREAVARSYM